MEITKTKDGRNMTLVISGVVNTVTSPELNEAIFSDIESVDNIWLDFADVDYITSSGLRVLLATEQAIMSRGRLTIRNANEVVWEVFEETGFDDIINFE